MTIRVGVAISLVFCALSCSAGALFNPSEIRDTSTLKPEVMQAWHEVQGPVRTRQKVMTINVGELWPGQEYRVPVRLIVPANAKAKGFWLTGGHQLKQFDGDAKLSGLESELLRRGVGVVHTIVQELGTWGQRELGQQMYARFLDTLNPRYSIQYWGWPAMLMRAVTAAYAEEEYFQPGKVAISGGSKNGASPSVALIHDDRITAQHATVSPIWESPLRLCDQGAWAALDAYNRKSGVQRPHRFLGGTYGPVYNRDALKAGRSWKELELLAEEMADAVFISKHFPALKRRGVDLLFEPGTHDFVCFDIAWGGNHYPEIPVFYQPGSGHGKPAKHPGTLKGIRNRDALLLRHFFPETIPPLLPVPIVDLRQEGDYLKVRTIFPKGTQAEGGRLFWMFNRPPEGSVAYLEERIPDENWLEMKFDESDDCWVGTIPVTKEHRQIDVFSSYWKTLPVPGRTLKTGISSPYTRIKLDLQKRGN